MTDNTEVKKHLDLNFLHFLGASYDTRVAFLNLFNDTSALTRKDLFKGETELEKQGVKVGMAYHWTRETQISFIKWNRDSAEWLMYYTNEPDLLAIFYKDWFVGKLRRIPYDGRQGEICFDDCRLLCSQWNTRKAGTCKGGDGTRILVNGEGEAETASFAYTQAIGPPLVMVWLSGHRVEIPLMRVKEMVQQ